MLLVWESYLEIQTLINVWSVEYVKYIYPFTIYFSIAQLNSVFAQPLLQLWWQRVTELGLLGNFQTCGGRMYFFPQALDSSRNQDMMTKILGTILRIDEQKKEESWVLTSFKWKHNPICLNHKDCNKISHYNVLKYISISVMKVLLVPDEQLRDLYCSSLYIFHLPKSWQKEHICRHSPICNAFCASLQL